MYRLRDLLFSYTVTCHLGIVKLYPSIGMLGKYCQIEKGISVKNTVYSVLDIICKF